MKHTSLALIIFGAVLTLGFALVGLILVPLSDSSLYEPTAVAHAYDELEARGYAVYHREGCAYCHSQQVRSVTADREYGTWVSQPGDYAYDAPAPVGRRRVGPDLRFTGDRHPSEDWYVEFLRDVHRSPQSFMPSYAHLPDEDIRALAAYLASRRGGYDERELMVAEQPRALFAEVPAPYAGLENPLPRAAEVIRLGGERYNTNCASCHGMAGDGQGPAAMAMSPPPANFTDAKYQEAEDAYLYWRIAEGVRGTMMPAWKSVFSEEQIWELIHYLRQFHGS